MKEEVLKHDDQPRMKRKRGNENKKESLQKMDLQASSRTVRRKESKKFVFNQNVDFDNLDDYYE